MTHPTRQHRYTALMATGLLAGAGAMSAASAAEVNKELQANVPDEYNNELIGVYDPQYPPSYFIDDEGDMVGYALDFQHAVADKLGIKSTAKQAKFASIIQGILGKRYNTSYFHDTPERREKMDFVDVHRTGTVVMVKSGNPDDLDLHQLCGHKVGVASGAHQQIELMPELQKECADNDQPEIEEYAFSGLNEGSMAVRTGRVQGWLGDSPSVGYIIKQTGDQFETTPTPHLTGYSGFAFAKGDPMANVVLDAIADMVDDGSYMAILENWHMESMALDAPVLNGD